jgi:hypothetical protein
MMRIKSILSLSTAIAMAVFTQGAQACAISAWSSATGITVADTGAPAAGFSRYSGVCGLKTVGGAKFVQDNSPGSANSYKARFYVRPEAGAAGTIFKARNAASASVLSVAANGTAFTFAVNGAVAATTVPYTAGAWYSVEMNFTAGAATTFTVTGNGGTLAPGGTSVIVTAAASGAGDVIANVQIGNIEAAGTGSIGFDEFDSRRTTAPGRLCRGDANGNGLIQGTDRTAITNDATGTLATGQADCTENGLVQGTDRTCVTNLIAAATSCI